MLTNESNFATNFLEFRRTRRDKKKRSPAIFNHVFSTHLQLFGQTNLLIPFFLISFSHGFMHHDAFDSTPSLLDIISHLLQYQSSCESVQCSQLSCHLWPLISKETLITRQEQLPEQEELPCMVIEAFLLICIDISAAGFPGPSFLF